MKSEKLNKKHPLFIHGYHITCGIMEALLNHISVLILLCVAIFIICNMFNIGTDDSDKDGWNRSGFEILTDHKTGIQYLYRRGAIIKREQSK